MRRVIPLLAVSLMFFGAGCAAPAGPGPSRADETSPAAAVPAPLPPDAAAVPAPPVAPPERPTAPLGEPLTGALARITKKPFGIRVSPGRSPVSPERFSGYHCGTDLETAPEEQAVDVPVSAVCDGTLLLKKRATGYGGVAVQSCVLDGRAVTIVYGHLRLSSVVPKVGDAVARGDRIAVLGTGYSDETDGERKHLHLGIHLGPAVDIKGYVQTQAALSAWLDAVKYLSP